MNNKPLINSLPNNAALDAALVKKISKILADAVSARGQASLAVSGGNTPRNMLAQLADEVLDWPRIHVLLVDERWVPTDHDDSNENMLRHTLLRGEAAHCQYLSLKTEDELAKDGQFSAEEILEELPWPLDVVHLGMGNDGHTASWFHDAPEYQQLQNLHTQRCIAVHPNSAPYPRLTLTPAAVLESRHVFIQLTGESKRELLEQAFVKGADYPISLVLHQDKVPVEIYWSP